MAFPQREHFFFGRALRKIQPESKFGRGIRAKSQAQDEVWHPGTPTSPVEAPTAHAEAQKKEWRQLLKPESSPSGSPNALFSRSEPQTSSFALPLRLPCTMWNGLREIVSALVPA